MRSTNTTRPQIRAELEGAKGSARGGGEAEVLIGLPGSNGMDVRDRLKGVKRGQLVGTPGNSASNGRVSGQLQTYSGLKSLPNSRHSQMCGLGQRLLVLAEHTASFDDAGRLPAAQAYLCREPDRVV